MVLHICVGKNVRARNGSRQSFFGIETRRDMEVLPLFMIEMVEFVVASLGTEEKEIKTVGGGRGSNWFGECN
jgi:hypothetical protein